MSACEHAKQLEDKRRELMKDERASATYWNGDTWGSISGFRDAEEWVNRELEKYRKQLEEASVARILAHNFAAVEIVINDNMPTHPSVKCGDKWIVDTTSLSIIQFHGKFVMNREVADKLVARLKEE